MLIVILVVLQIITSKITKDKAQDVIKKFQPIYFYLPKTRVEYRWYLALSVSAGICEEIIFRLFMFTYFLETINLAVAFLFTNLIFALTHYGSSLQNLINTLVLGLLFTAIYYFTGNIWLPIIVHISIDIYTGYLCYRAYKLSIQD